MIKCKYILSLIDRTNIFVFGWHLCRLLVIAILLTLSTDALSSDELDKKIEDATRSLDEVRLSVLSLEKDLLLNQQSLGQLDLQIEEIENAYRKPRSREIENTLFEFERARDEVKLFVAEQSGKVEELEALANVMEKELNILRKEQLRFVNDESMFRIDDIEEDEPEPDAFGKLQDAVVALMGKTDEAHNDLKEERSSFLARVENFQKKAEEISREVTGSMDIMYEKMFVKYEAMKSQGWVIMGGEPKKPAGYDQRQHDRIGGSAGIYVPPKNASEKSNRQQRIDDLKEKIKNTSDPQEKANLEELLREMESVQ